MDGELNFKAIFDYASAEKGVDQLVDAFENGSVRINEAFNLGKAAEGNKREIKQMIDTANEALKELETMYRNTMREIEKSGGIKYATNEQKEYIAGLKEGVVGLRSTIKGLRENMQDTQDVFSGLASGLQGLMGAYTALSGIMAQFGADSEDLQKVQTKLQASMSILMGIQQVYNTFLGNSAFRLGVLSKATELYEAVTKKAAISAGLMKVALGGVATAALVAIALLARWASKRQEGIKKEKELAKATNDTAASQLVAYRKLQTQWQKANGELEKQRKIVASDDWKKLGLSVKSVNDAERILINNTEDVVKALVARARAQASYTKLQEDVQKQLELEDKERNFQSEKQDQKNKKEIDASLNRQKASDIRRQVEESQIWRNSDARYRQDEKSLGLTDENGDRFYVDKKGKRVYRPKTGDNSYEVAIWEGQARGAMGNTKTQPLLDYASYLDKQAEYFDAAAEGFQNQINKSQKKIDEGNKAIMERFNIAQDDDNAWKKILEDAGIKTNDDANYNDSMAQAGYNSSKMAKELAIKRKRELKDIEFEVREARVSAMKESSAKELAQMSLDHDKEMESLNRQKEDRLKQLQDEDRELKMAANPNLKDYQVGSNIRELPKEEAEMYAEQEKLLNEAYQRASSDLLLKYDSLTVQRADLEKKWAETIETTTDERIKQILEKERNLELAQFDEQAVEQFGTKSQKYKAMKARMDAEVDALVDDTQKKIAQAANDVELTEFLFGDPAAYNNLAQAKEAVTAIYDARIKQAQAEEDVVKEQQLQRELAQQLLELQKQYSATFALIYADAQKLTTNQLQKAIVATQEAIKEAAGSGDIQALTDLYSRLREQMNVMGDRERGWGFSGMVSGANRLQDADFKRMQAEALSAIDADMFAEEIKRLMEDAINDDEQGWAAINKGAQEVKETLGGIGEMLQSFGDDTEGWAKSLYDVGGFLEGLSSGLDNIETAFSKTASAGDKISVAVSGTIQIFGMVLDSIRANKEAQEEWNRTIDESGHRLAMLRLEALDYKQQNIFGVENPYKKAIDGAVQYSASMEELAKMTAKLNEGQVQTGTKKVVDWSKVGKGAATGVAAGASIGSFFGPIGTAIGAAIGAGVGAIAGALSRKTVPVFESLQKQYGQLFNPDTYELNEKLIADYDKLDDATKQIVDNWDEIVAKAKEAEEQMRENFSNLAGDIGTQLSDSLVDAFKNGELDGAVDDFHKKMNATIEDIIQQMVFSNVFSGMFDELQKDMEASFRGPNADNNIVDDLIRFEEAYRQGLADYEEQMNDARKYLQSKGYDAWENEDERKAQTRTALGASQDSVDESNARLTTIQGHTYEINENVRKLVAAAGLSAAAGAILPSFPAMEPVAARDYSEDLLRIREELGVLSKNDDRFMAAIAELQSVTEGIRASSQRTSENTDEANAVAARIRSNLETVVDRGVTMR